MKRSLRYLLLFILVGLLGYKSIYFKKLSSMQSNASGKFDASAFARTLWNTHFSSKLDSAISLNQYITELNTNAESAFKKYSNAIGIGNYRYSLVKLTGRAIEITADDILLTVFNSDSLNVKLALEYIYGNAIRDASGLVDIKNFTNNDDLIAVSEQLNKIIRDSIVPPFKKSIQLGNKVEMVGAIELNKEHIDFREIEILPLRLKILPQ